MSAVVFFVGTLAIMGSLHHIDKDLLVGGYVSGKLNLGWLNGRPEKLPDVGISMETGLWT